MTEKTTAWTPEELAEIRRERRGNWEETFEARLKGPVKLWDWQDHICPEYEYCVDCVNQAHDEAAAVVFGMLGMAHAIRETYLCPDCGCWEGNVTRRGWGCQCTNDE